MPLGPRQFCICSRHLGDAVKAGSSRKVVLIYNCAHHLAKPVKIFMVKVIVIHCVDSTYL